MKEDVLATSRIKLFISNIYIYIYNYVYIYIYIYIYIYAQVHTHDTVFWVPFLA